MVQATSPLDSIGRLRQRVGDVERLLGSAAPFSALSSVGRRRLLEASRFACFAMKELVYEAGAQAKELVLLLEGRIQIECPRAGERRGRVVAMIEAPYMLGEAQVLHDRSFTGTGVALEEVLAAFVPKETLEHLIETEPRFAIAYTRELAFRFLQVIEARRQNNDEPAVVLAKYVLSYCAISGDGRVPFEQGELASATGLCRETVNRTLKRWAQRGLLRVTRGAIESVDIDALRGMVDSALPSLVQLPVGSDGPRI